MLVNISPSCSFRFNPRARRGRDVIPVTMVVVGREVSIHAPAGGATTINYGGFVHMEVSIHAPAGGATKAFHALQG